MRILLSNDDGYLAPGLKCLAGAVDEFADITVVAPDRNRSGASNSLTLATPLRARRGTNGFFFVDGTPTDCVHIAITGLMEEEPDMVIAGINMMNKIGTNEKKPRRVDRPIRNSGVKKNQPDKSKNTLITI